MKTHARIKFKVAGEAEAQLWANYVAQLMYAAGKSPSLRFDFTIAHDEVIENQQVFAVEVSFDLSNLNYIVSTSVLDVMYGFLDPDYSYPEEVKDLVRLDSIDNPHASQFEKVAVKNFASIGAMMRAKEFFENKRIERLEAAATSNATYINEFLIPMVEHLVEVTKSQDKLKELLPTKH